jgi:hypothetical protein
MAIQIKNATRDDRGNTKNGTWLKLVLVIIAVLVGLILLKMFYWDTDSERHGQGVSEAPAPRATASAPRDSISPAVQPSSPGGSAVPRPVRLDVAPSDATYPLGEPGVFFVNVQTVRLPSRGSVTVVYDPKVIELKNIRSALGGAPFNVSSQIENRSGSVTVNLTSTATGQEKQAQISLFAIDFVGVRVGRSTVVLTAATFTDARGSSVPVEVTNGEVEISGE